MFTLFLRKQPKKYEETNSDSLHDSIKHGNIGNGSRGRRYTIFTNEKDSMCDLIKDAFKSIEGSNRRNYPRYLTWPTTKIY